MLRLLSHSVNVCALSNAVPAPPKSLLARYDNCALSPDANRRRYCTSSALIQDQKQS